MAGLWNGATRATLVVFGGLLTLQSSDRLDPIKLAYLLVAGIAFAGSGAAVWRARREPSTISMRPWLVAGAIVLSLVALSLPVALVQGATITNWLRDGAAYVLLGAAPWVALDLARSASPRLILGAGLLAGLLGVASFVVEWVQRRHLADLPFDRLALPSLTLGAAAYCIAIACAVRSRGRTRAAWVLLSMGIVGAFLLTGTRTSFVLLAAPVAVVLVDIWQQGRAEVRALALTIGAQFVAVAFVLFVSLGTFPSPPVDSAVGDPSPSPTTGQPGSGGPAGPTAPPGPDLEDRFSTLDDIASGRDQSLLLRIEQTRVAWEVFLRSPLLGAGLGHEFTWKVTSTLQVHALTMDTPAIVLAKFGILGLLLTGSLLAAHWLVLRGMIRRTGASWRALALVGYGAVLVALIPFGWPPEDKGTSFALVLLLALVPMDRNSSSETRV